MGTTKTSAWTLLLCSACALAGAAERDEDDAPATPAPQVAAQAVIAAPAATQAAATEPAAKPAAAPPPVEAPTPGSIGFNPFGGTAVSDRPAEAHVRSGGEPAGLGLSLAVGLGALWLLWRLLRGLDD